ncbi:MAG: iron-regulated protein [Cytophagales bacterium]|nr:MAG: iron-regulated protein [Cytophagales bacterium]
MKTTIFSLIFCLVFIGFSEKNVQAQKNAYQIFDKTGKKTTYEEMLKNIAKSDIVFFGELHNNSIAHWLELELFIDLYNIHKTNLLIGAEMFEADNQLIINEYFQKHISTKNFEEEAKLWDNYKTDYKPIVEKALQYQIPLIATNVPRRYASMVAKKGLESLNSLENTALSYMPPLPLEINLQAQCYANMIQMMQNGHGGDMKPENFAKAQGLKDATMAFHIEKYWTQGKVLLHFNGAYHSDNFEGILLFIKKTKNIQTISFAEQDQTEQLDKENIGKANFIIISPKTMSKSY